MRTGLGIIAFVVLGAILAAAMAQEEVPGEKRAGADCVPVGSWTVPGGGRIEGTTLIAGAARRSVVLLGESHETAEHHRWQLQMLAALHALRPDMVIGFEMFPRRVQKALDRWVAGELSEAAFLKAADWSNVWRFDPKLYMPLFHFARMNRIPMLALNIDGRLTREVTKRGFDSIPEAEREGVTRPAAPSRAYLDFLLPIYREHERGGGKRPQADQDDPDFRRFVESQQMWDRAMAQALHTAAARPEQPLVIGIMGTGHLAQGYGVPHQLKDLGVTDGLTLLPWGPGSECRDLVAGYADAVFGVAAPAAVESKRQRLGIRIERAEEAIRIIQIEPDSVAEKAGLRPGDVIVEIAGLTVKEMADVIEAVRRQAPGTWLPLKVQRGDVTLEIIAKFLPLPQ